MREKWAVKIECPQFLTDGRGTCCLRTVLESSLPLLCYFCAFKSHFCTQNSPFLLFLTKALPTDAPTSRSTDGHTPTYREMRGRIWKRERSFWVNWAESRNLRDTINTFSENSCFYWSCRHKYSRFRTPSSTVGFVPLSTRFCPSSSFPQS